MRPRGRLRIHFTGADLTRTQIASGPDPFWETVLSLCRLRDQAVPPPSSSWGRARERMSRSAYELLSVLVPVRGNFPDFLTPPEGLLGLEAGLEALLSTPLQRMRADLAALRRRIPAPFSTMGTRNAVVMKALAAAVREYYTVMLAPHWEVVEEVVRADQAVRRHLVHRKGVEAMLAALPSPLRWESPTLVSDYPIDKDLYLDGRGIVLIPSYFCRNAPVTLIDPVLPPVLVFPAAHSRSRSLADSGRRLAPLLGTTRAAVLRTLADGRSTTELARTLGISPSSASEHAAVLRNAGLLTSVRWGNTVVHELTPLGRALLHGIQDGRP